MDELYRNIWKCLEARIKEKIAKDSLKSILPNEVLRIMYQIEVEHLREEVVEEVSKL